MLRKGSKMATFKCLGGKLARDSDNMLRTVEWVVGVQGQNVMYKSLGTGRGPGQHGRLRCWPGIKGRMPCKTG